MAKKYERSRRHIRKILVLNTLSAMTPDELDHAIRLHIVKCTDCTSDKPCKSGALLIAYAVRKRHLKANGTAPSVSTPKEEENHDDV